MRKLLIPIIIIVVSIYNHGLGHAVNFIVGLLLALLLLAGFYAGGKALWHKVKK